LPLDVSGSVPEEELHADKVNKQIATGRKISTLLASSFLKFCPNYLYSVSENR